MGITVKRIPIPKPAIKRATRNIATLTEPEQRAAPISMMKAPVKTLNQQSLKSGERLNSASPPPFNSEESLWRLLSTRWLLINAADSNARRLKKYLPI